MPIRYIIQSPKFALTLQKISPPETNPKGDLLIIINNILFYDVGVKIRYRIFLPHRFPPSDPSDEEELHLPLVVFRYKRQSISEQVSGSAYWNKDPDGLVPHIF